MVQRRRARTAAGAYALAAALVGGSSAMAWAATDGEPPGPVGQAARGQAAATNTKPANTKPTNTKPAPRDAALATMPADSPAVTRFTGGLDAYGVWQTRGRVCVGERAIGPDGLETGGWLPQWCSTPGASGDALLSGWQVGDGDVVPTYRLLLLPRGATSGSVGGRPLDVIALGGGRRVALAVGSPRARLVLREPSGRVVVDRRVGALVDPGQVVTGA